MATGSGTNTTIPIAEEALARSASRSPHEDGDTAEDTSTKSDSRDADVDNAYNGLTLESVVDVKDDEDDQDGKIEIDVVHVIGASKKQAPGTSFFLANFLPKTSRKRQYLFEFDMSNMLNNDSEITKMQVETQARKLLHDLTDLRQSSDQSRQRPLIFLAYDIGAVILKKAISIASKYDEGYLEIYMTIARIVFVGCFNRGSEEELGLRIFSFLNNVSVSNDEEVESNWKPRITLSSVQSLATTTRLTNAAFLASKISLRCRTFSLYAGSSPKRIHSTLSYYFATLGLPSELAIQEQESGDMAAAFPGLLKSIDAGMDGWALLGSSQLALEHSTLSLAAPESPLWTRAPSLDHPVINSDAHGSWLQRKGTTVVHLEGLDPQASTEAAEQLSIDWVRRQQLRGEYSPRSFLFRFCACDPQRNSVTAMLTACILHFFRLTRGVAEVNQRLLQDQYKLQNAWKEEDMCNIVLASYTWMREASPLVLLGFDESDPRGRRRFWTLVGEIASRSEEEVKIIVTGSKPGSYTAEMLREELKEWPEVDVLEWKVTAEEPKIDADQKVGTHALVSRLYPSRFGSGRVRKALQRLQSMDPAIMSQILNMVEAYSRWPTEESKNNLATFLDVINLVEPAHTPSEAAWAILRHTAPEEDLLMNVLPWMLDSQRPLTLEELASIIAFSRSRDDQQLDPPKFEEIERVSRQIGKQFRGLASLDGDTFRIRSDVLELLADGFTKECEKMREQATELTANTLLQYLKLGETQKRLRALFERYEDRLKYSGDAITSPIASDGKDVLFYAVQALPHHLSSVQIPEDVESQMTDPSGPYDAWSNVYWAMSNPFSRAPQGPLKSAWNTWESTAEFGPPSMVRSRGDNSRDTEMRLPIESLAEAVKANNEDLALTFAEEVISDLQLQQRPPNTDGEEQALTFPPPILWRAVWLDMDRLLALLLRHSKQHDDTSSASCPSILYMACITGSAKSVDVLLSHGADTRVKRNGTITPLQSVCMRGNVKIIHSLLKKDPSLLALPQPKTPLSNAACWGCWPAVLVLLAKGADLNQPEKDPEPTGEGDSSEGTWLPINITSNYGHARTTRILLEHEADPNVIGPFGMDTCLWVAAIYGKSVETMKELLDHGSNPNDEKLEPPLLTEIIINTKIPEEIKLRMFDLLLNNDPPVDLNRAGENGVTPLMVAAEGGSLFAVHWLLKNGASVNTTDSGDHTALFLAVAEGKWDVVDEFLGHHEKSTLDLVCSHGQTQLEMAIDNIDGVRKLLDAGSDPNFVNKAQKALLNRAVALQKTDVVKMLLEPGRDVDVHHRDSAGWSPILDATGDVPNPEIARMLMEAGASFADTSGSGYSPLHYAVWSNQPEVLRVLLEFHEMEDLARRGNFGEIPLLAACDLTSQGAFECIRLLVRAGSDINSEDSDGHTLLTRSAKLGSGGMSLQKWLLARPNINLHAKATGSGTALHIACMYGNDELVDMLLQKGADANSEVMYLRSTPLIATCMPVRQEVTEEPQSRIERVERIVRALVAKGADVSLTSGIIVFNALCAAALCAGVETINFLLDKAASKCAPDPLGRLPIHFAAASGFRNFKAVAQAHGEDIMVPDKFGKNALHWAAQFGNAETVKAILDGVSSPTNKKSYANSKDSDGWTPLAWASRPTAHDNGPLWVRSEPPDYEATIQHLLDHGGDVSLPFRIGSGDESEELTPLRMAKRCEADDAVIKLLTPMGEHSDQSGKEPVYVKSSGFCDFCFSQCRGLDHGCQMCGTTRYVLCKKCYPSASSAHRSRFAVAHMFVISGSEEDQFVTQPASSVVSELESAAGEEAEAVEADVDAGGGSDESTPDFEPIDFQEDDIQRLEIPDLDDLGDLDGL